MAVTFPLIGLFNRYAIKTVKFFPDERQSISRNGAGVATVVDLRMPVWKASFVSAAMSEDDCIALEAELATLRGAANRFVARDTRRPYPRLGPQSTAAYSSAAVSGFNLPGNQVSFSGLPANLQLSIGDRFRIFIGGTRFLYALAEPILVDGAGDSGLVQVVPQLHPLIAVGGASFANPNCDMQIVPGSVQFSASGNLLGTVSFEAEQIL